jgi:acetyltransferase-like isoleucine patch superfamily enzyme
MEFSDQQDPVHGGLPDRPIPGYLRPLRALMRRARLARIALKSRGKVRFGKDVSIGGAAVMLPPNSATFGRHVRVGREFLLQTDLRVGDEVLISSRVGIVGNDHSFDRSAGSVFFAGRLPATETVIEGDNLIGFGVLIVGGVTIGHGCIVGAGSVVTSDLPPDSVCAGVPARVIRDRIR